jgi:hypothetical protein
VPEEPVTRPAAAADGDVVADVDGAVAEDWDVTPVAEVCCAGVAVEDAVDLLVDDPPQPARTSTTAADPARIPRSARLLCGLTERPP